MRCPFCDNQETKVIDSRPTEDGHAIRRRRECERCSRRFTTYEKVEEVILMVVKKDGSREAFDRRKIMKIDSKMASAHMAHTFLNLLYIICAY